MILFGGLNTKKALLRMQQGFFGVAGNAEISNLLKHFYMVVDLYDNMVEIFLMAFK